ncbi:hypothetical protein QMO56_13645 [Roseomonas sp. E05]|uniref:hypothetical protein n=1 Tax=Roseomonas sp. E05 TaxID=3046310 RepID=UPI0024BA3AF0|nr:hypothetical protein [Roseomonas sp. E05]MDJ0389161.1 hypothetical protein [Roseomonas sp. E05]
MPTLMTRPSFERLAQVRTRLIDHSLPSARPGQAGVAGLFLPWAGRRLAEAGGIYWIGAATEGDYGAEGEQSFEACHERGARLCDRGPHAHAHTPLWLFLDGLTRGLLGGSYDMTTERWGWSNLLKIGWSVGTPESWPAELIERQQPACAAALREELAGLRRSLVFVGSEDDFGILGEALGGMPEWHGKQDEVTGIWWLHDEVSGNLIVHGCHPSAARRGHFSKAALERTVLLARDLLPHFT